MKRVNFNIVRYLSLFLGLAFLLGVFWYGANLEYKTIYSVLITLSTSLALLITPLIPVRLLKYTVIQILIILLLIVGAINNIYMMYGDLTFIYEVDWPAFILRLIALYLLAIIFWRTIKSGDNEDQGNSKDSIHNY